MVGRIVYRVSVDGVEICIQQLGRVKEKLFDYHMIRVCHRLKRVIVTPVVYQRFLKFLHIDIQRALGAHCHDLGHDSRMTSCLK